MENKAKAQCQAGNKAMKMKLTNILRRKERKNGYESYTEVDEEDLYTSKINCKGERIVGKANKGINVWKYNRLKK